ncbi:Co2+/Mg2+ efflux protein ApaG [Flavobacterium oreochromis]|uniref:Co2+/Mg2+ efflux protein ApaG n=2 Tax=Flavobacterium TaxID=237 RepID=A0A2D0AHW6_9FLAO|nr:Co2+/Mg2+ efflux protein ApaG [Flavobacterium oreochromis]OWP75377.1 Co2+/Mg2+ efflux protein ApaG [Flavobacterium oreochromis]OWP77708.1 Co2+/Mg2+ efflux protein ApaG [Flavobacterium oreochromis]POR24879.1 Co2+/Mg2+ efflux protein ApaG [Flavobacterium columnare]QYS87593.1 Co2+/Mg2+ efflux protein ApaG [Flavobacterium oreochromis]
MVTQVTKGIKISVQTIFEGTYFKNQSVHFAFSYHITIENHSKDQVQLLSRHWDIYDALNYQETVEGEGVVGEKPILKSGEVYTYSSGCLLSSPHGSMTGYFTMINFATTKKFDVAIPIFYLNAPFALS